MRKAIFLFAGFILLSACGGGSGGGMPEGNASVGIVVTGTQERDSLVLAGRIARFLIRLEGEGMESLEEEVPTNAQEVELNNVLPGAGRRITVTAFNRDGTAIRTGASEEFSIAQGETKEVSVQLHAIPIFVNVHDGNVVTNRRLVFEILADPAEAFTIEDTTADGAAEPLFSLATGSPEVRADASTGLGYFNPVDPRLGERLFQVRSVATGNSSQVRLVVTDNEIRRPATFYSAGNIAERGSHLEPSRLGQWFAGSNQPGGGLWPHILIQQLYLEDL